MKKFTGVDFCQLDASLTEEERLVRDTVRDFVDQEIIPHVSGWNRAGSFPRDLIKKIAEIGLLGANLEGYGCAAMGPVAYGLTMQELERGDSGIRSFASVQGALCMYPIYAFGSEEQKQRYLARLISGAWTGTMCLTEAHCGTDLGMLRTKAEPAEDGSYKITGTKIRDDRHRKSF